MPAPLILDSGAVIGETRHSQEVRALLAAARELDQDVLVPAGVVAECTRGGPRDALINRLLHSQGVEVTNHDESRARTAGHLLGEAGINDAIDALVVAEGVHRGEAVIATSDPDDFGRLAHRHPTITLIRV